MANPIFTTTLPLYQVCVSFCKLAGSALLVYRPEFEKGKIRGTLHLPLLLLSRLEPSGPRAIDTINHAEQEEGPQGERQWQPMRVA